MVHQSNFQCNPEIFFSHYHKKNLKEITISYLGNKHEHYLEFLSEAQSPPTIHHATRHQQLPQNLRKFCTH